MWQENKSKGKLNHSSEEQALLVKHKFVQKVALISIISISQAMLSDTCYKERIFSFSLQHSEEWGKKNNASHRYFWQSADV